LEEHRNGAADYDRTSKCHINLFGCWVVTITRLCARRGAEPDGSDLQELIVTGTRQTTRTVAESPAPIDVLSAEDLTKSGKQSVRGLIATLVPSVSASNSGAGASFAIKTASMRGLSSDQVLVLVNGKRRHNTAVMFINGTTQNGQSPADLDLIPASAIERVEVLRDGASAQYGSDAIAGVINLILKSGRSGFGTSTLYGETGERDGATTQISPDIGLPIGSGGHLHLSADGRIQDRTDAAPGCEPQLRHAGVGSSAVRCRRSRVSQQPLRDRCRRSGLVAHRDTRGRSRCAVCSALARMQGSDPRP
jgi:outer membrane receptor for ferrienterochelin and colicin